MADLVKLKDPPSTFRSPVWRQFGLNTASRKIYFTVASSKSRNTTSLVMFLKRKHNTSLSGPSNCSAEQTEAKLVLASISNRK